MEGKKVIPSMPATFLHHCSCGSSGSSLLLCLDVSSESFPREQELLELALA